MSVPFKVIVPKTSQLNCHSLTGDLYIQQNYSMPEKVGELELCRVISVTVTGERTFSICDELEPAGGDRFGQPGRVGKLVVRQQLVQLLCVLALPDPETTPRSHPVRRPVKCGHVESRDRQCDLRQLRQDKLKAKKLLGI